MSLFPIIDCDSIVQVDDKFRIDASKSYKNPNESAISAVEIEPHTGLGFINITGDLTKPNPELRWFLDYQYSSAGAKVVSLKITAGVSIVTVTKTVTVVTAATDNLFSTDDLIKEIQEDVYKLLPPGKATFKYKHRAAQNYILDWLWNNGYYKTVGTGIEPYVAADILDIEFISDWSAYVTLRMIYESAFSQVADIFKAKADDFKNKEERAREKFILRLDTDDSGDIQSNEGIQVTSRRLIRV